MLQPKVFKIHVDGPSGVGLKPINVMDLSNIVSGTATEIGTFDCTDPTRQFTVDIWECTPCGEYIPYYPCDEFCVILKGGIKITQKDDTEDYFGKGEGFMVLRGTQCNYGMTETTRKYSIMFENKLQA